MHQTNHLSNQTCLIFNSAVWEHCILNSKSLMTFDTVQRWFTPCNSDYRHLCINVQTVWRLFRMKRHKRAMVLVTVQQWWLLQKDTWCKVTAWSAVLVNGCKRINSEFYDIKSYFNSQFRIAGHADTNQICVICCTRISLLSTIWMWWN